MAAFRAAGRVKPVAFTYHAPRTVDDALNLLDELRDQEAKVLAGGQSLMPMLNMRLVRPQHLVDINGVAELNYVRVESDGATTVGALTRHRTLEQSSEIRQYLPLVAEAVPHIGDRLIRYRGTIGGSLAHADPSAELPTLAVTLDAELVVGKKGTTRTIPAADFFFGYLTTALGEDELVLAIRFPPLARGAGVAFKELVRQHGQFAIVSAAAGLVMESGQITEARVCLGGVAPTPIRATNAEQLLCGERPSATLFREAASRAADATEPSADVHGSAEYRRDMALVYAELALTAAASRVTASLAEANV